MDERCGCGAKHTTPCASRLHFVAWGHEGRATTHPQDTTKFSSVPRRLTALRRTRSASPNAREDTAHQPRNTNVIAHQSPTPSHPFLSRHALTRPHTPPHPHWAAPRFIIISVKSGPDELMSSSLDPPRAPTPFALPSGGASPAPPESAGGPPGAVAIGPPNPPAPRDGCSGSGCELGCVGPCSPANGNASRPGGNPAAEPCVGLCDGPEWGWSGWRLSARWWVGGGIEGWEVW